MPNANNLQAGCRGQEGANLSPENVRTLAHGSKTDEEVWNEFRNNWEKLVVESEKLLGKFKANPTPIENEEIISVKIPSRETEKIISVKQRIYQDFFRRSVLSSHNNRCCISAVETPQLLVAGHIIPWSISKEHRLNPENGLSLCVLFDKAFDCGLMTIDEQFKVVYSKRIKNSTNDFVKCALLKYEGQKISLPNRFCPRQEFLSWHRENLFVE